MAKQRRAAAMFTEQTREPCPDAREGLRLVKLIEHTIETQISARAYAKAGDFFGGVLDRARSVGRIIERTGESTPPAAGCAGEHARRGAPLGPR